MATGAGDPAARLAAGEHEQVLFVAPHAGGQVVQREQARQSSGSVSPRPNSSMRWICRCTRVWPRRDSATNMACTSMRSSAWSAASRRAWRWTRAERAPRVRRSRPDRRSSIASTRADDDDSAVLTIVSSRAAMTLAIAVGSSIRAAVRAASRVAAQPAAGAHGEQRGRHDRHRHGRPDSRPRSTCCCGRRWPRARRRHEPSGERRPGLVSRSMRDVSAVEPASPSALRATALSRLSLMIFRMEVAFEMAAVPMASE